MLILPPYSRREDEQPQSVLKFSGTGTFEKVPEKNNYLSRSRLFPKQNIAIVPGPEWQPIVGPILFIVIDLILEQPSIRSLHITASS